MATTSSASSAGAQVLAGRQLLGSELGTGKILPDRGRLDVCGPHDQLVRLRVQEFVGEGRGRTRRGGLRRGGGRTASHGAAQILG